MGALFFILQKYGTSMFFTILVSLHICSAELESNKESKMVVARTLGLAIIPGEHIVSIAVAKLTGSMK